MNVQDYTYRTRRASFVPVPLNGLREDGTMESLGLVRLETTKQDLPVIIEKPEATKKKDDQ